MAKKAYIWIMMVCLVCINVMPLFPAYAFSGSGTATNPYVITTCTELQNINANLTASYVLGNDIDCSDTVNWDSGKGFLPIGNSTTKFAGTFNGNGYTISNVTIKRPDDMYNGIFGYAEGPNVVIQNVTLKNITIDGGIGFAGTLLGYGYTGVVIKNIEVTGYINGGDYVGGLASFFRGTSISNVRVKATVIGDEKVGGIVGSFSGAMGGTISNVVYKGDVTGASNVGGILGYMIVNGVIKESYSEGNVIGIASKYSGQIGGLVGGTKASTISDSYSTSAVTCSNCATTIGAVGGFIGYMESGTVQNAYSTGKVTTNVTTKGGFMGQYVAGAVTNSYWNKETSGLTTSAKGVGKTTAELKNPLTYTGGDVVNTWIISSSINNGYPALRKTPFPKYIEVKNTNETHDASNVSLSWVNDSDIDNPLDHVNVYRNGVKIAQVTGSVYQDTSLLGDTSYTYKLTTVDVRQNESSGIILSVKTTDNIPPSSITNPDATEKDANITLTWKNPLDYDFYKVVLKRNGSILYEGGSETFTDTTTQEKRVYTYEWIAYDIHGNQSVSQQLTVTTEDRKAPGAVTNVQLTEENHELKIKWDNPMDNDIVNIQLKKNGVTVYEGLENNWIDTDIKEKETYTYEWLVFDEVGKTSPLTSQSIYITDKTAPEEVQHVLISDEVEKNVLTWVNPSDTDLKEVELYENNVLVYQGLKTIYTNESAVYGKEYEYRFVSIDDTGNRSNSITVNLTKKARKPMENVKNLIVSEKKQVVMIAWNNPIDDRFDYIRIYKNGQLLKETNQSQYEDKNAGVYQTNVYKIVAVDKNGATYQPLELAITTSDKEPKEVINVVGVYQPSKMILSWKAGDSLKPKEYRIYRNNQLIKITDGNTLIDNEVKEGSQYTYVIYAYSQTGLSSKGINYQLNTPQPPKVEKPIELPSTNQPIENPTPIQNKPKEEVKQPTEPSTEKKPIVIVFEQPKSQVKLQNTDKEVERKEAQTKHVTRETKTSEAEKKEVFSVPKIETPTIKVIAKKSGYQLTWKHDSSIKKVLIYRDGKLIAETTNTTFYDQEVKKGKKPSYKLVFVSESGQKFEKHVAPTEQLKGEAKIEKAGLSWKTKALLAFGFVIAVSLSGYKVVSYKKRQ